MVFTSVQGRGWRAGVRGALPALAALLIFTLAAWQLGGPALRGKYALGPDCLVDNEGLFAVREPPHLAATGDLTSIVADLPRDTRMARGLRAGRFDTWNPLVGTGEPLWAEQGGPLFPLKWLFYLRPSITTWDLFRLSRLLVAAFGVWFLARRRGLPPIAATAAGLAFEVSGCMVGQITFGCSSPIFLLPWVIAGADAIARGSESTVGARALRGPVAGSALALGIAGSGGHPSLILLIFVAFVAMIAGHAARRVAQPRRALRIAAAGVAGALLGLALGAPFSLPLSELIPFAESYKDGPRSVMVFDEWIGRMRQMAVTGALHPEQVIAARTDQSTHLPFGVGSYLGRATFVLATVGLLAGALDLGLLLCALLGIGLVLAPSPLSWLHSLPGLRLVLPPYAWPLVVLPVTLACGRGVALVERVGAWAGTPVRADTWRRRIPPRVLRVLTFVGPAAALLLLLLVGRYPVKVMKELLREPVSRVLREPPSPGIEVLQRELAHGGRLLGLPLAIGYPNTPMLFDLPDLRALAALPSKRLRTYFSLVGPIPALLTTHTVSRMRSPLLDIADVRMLVRSRGSPRYPVPPEVDGDDETRLVHSDTYLALYRNLAAAGSAWVVHDVTRVRTMEQAADWLRPYGTRLEHARQLGLLSQVVIEAPRELVIPLDQPPEGAEESAQVIDARDPQHLVIEASLGADGLVVVSEAFAPGWSATVDGKPVTIVAADVLFRAVPVPGGKHRIELRYRSAGFHTGLGTAAVALLVIAALLWRRGVAQA